MKDKSLEQTECLSCAIVQGLKQPSGGTIVENDFFHAHQDIAYPLPGMVILAAKRHIRCLDESHQFHMWMIPRYEWMNEFGRSIESVRPILVYTREHMNDEENLAYVKSCVQNLRSALSR